MQTLCFCLHADLYGNKYEFNKKINTDHFISWLVIEIGKLQNKLNVLSIHKLVRNKNSLLLMEPWVGNAVSSD